MININSFINNNNVNLIEIYLSGSKENDDKIDINVNNETLEKLKGLFKNTRELTYIYFYKNNLEYIYDTSNDSQLLITRKFVKDEYKTTSKNIIYIQLLLMKVNYLIIIFLVLMILIIVKK